MKVLLVAAFALGGLFLNVPAPASAASLTSGAHLMQNATDITNVQYTRGGSREFRRCMRAKYGPRYFSRVPRAHRYHMAQACGG